MRERREDSVALSAYRVLELSPNGRASFCGKLLADFGADVLKIERPGGDPVRNLGPFKDDLPHLERSLSFLYYNTNKRGLTLNLETADGRELFRRLVERADVLVESLAPGELDRLGLGYEALCQVNPRIIVTSITGFGQRGPHQDYEAPDIIPFAMGGLMFITGRPEGPPVVAPGQQAYDIAGIHAALGTLIALWVRQATGRGQHIDVSAQEVIAAEEHTISRYALDGHIVQREGSQHGALAPGRIFPAQDGFFHLLVGQPWKSCMEWLGNPEALQGEAWFSQTFRRENIDVVDPYVERHTSHRPKLEVVEEAQRYHLPCTPVFTPGEFLESAHLQARGYLIDADHPKVGPHRFPGAPVDMSETPWQWRCPAPLVGQHNREVYCGELGLATEELVALFSAGVI